MLQTEHKVNDQVQSRKDDLEYYTSIKERVLKARRCYYDWTITLPETVRKIILQMSKVTCDKYPDRLFGERDAFWLGELVGAKEKDQLTAAVASICGYTYFLHQDNIIDGDTGVVRRTELALNFLYAKLLENFQSITQSSHSSFWCLWNKYLKEYSEGILIETTRFRFSRCYSREDLSLVAARSAPVKICGATLALASGKSQEINIMETAIEELTIGLQLRDDLADCVEDFFRGNYTPVVSRLIGNKKPCIIALKRTALYTNAVEELIEQSTMYLHKASKTLRLQAGMSLLAYIDYLCNQNYMMKARIQQVRKAVLLPAHLENTKAPLLYEEKDLWKEIHEATQIRLEY